MPDQFDKYRKLMGKEVVDEFLAKFGLGPNYTPLSPKTYTCPECNNKSATIKELHADTDINTMEISCPDCNFSKEI